MKFDDVTSKRGNSRFLLPYFVSLSSLVLCCAMFLGTTYAWFTSDISNTGNRIDSSNLSIDVLHGGVSLRTETDHAVFSVHAWVPDHIEMKTVQLCNTGGLPLHYKVDFVPDELNVASTAVTELFQVYVKVGELTVQDLTAQNGMALDSAEWNYVGTLAQVMSDEACLILSENFAQADEQELAKEESQPISIALYLPEEAKNRPVMGSNVNLFLAVDAWQVTQVADSNASA